MSGIVKHKGIALALGGEEYIVPPISLGALEQMQDAIGNFTGDVMDKKQVASVIDATHASLKRNYPDMMREQVADLVDVANMAEVFEAVMDVSGIKRKGIEAGEVPPGNP